MVNELYHTPLKTKFCPGQTGLFRLEIMYMKSIKLMVILVLGALTAASAAQKLRWVAYKSNLLNLQVSVPADWKPAKIPNALAFRYDDLAGGTAGIGILKSSAIGNITEGADKEFNQEGRPADWTRSDAKVGGMTAIKIAGTDAKSSERRIVHYYVETPNGVYLVQCQGTADRWTTFSPILATILSKLT